VVLLSGLVPFAKLQSKQTRKRGERGPFVGPVVVFDSKS